jgi:hypothetical protein
VGLLKVAREADPTTWLSHLMPPAPLVPLPIVCGPLISRMHVPANIANSILIVQPDGMCKRPAMSVAELYVKLSETFDEVDVVQPVLGAGTPNALQLWYDRDTLSDRVAAVPEPVLPVSAECPHAIVPPPSDSALFVLVSVTFVLAGVIVVADAVLANVAMARAHAMMSFIIFMVDSPSQRELPA